ncbi:hypothetical protein [Kribbella sp. NPDC050470]|uniref:hypothetical protein n=1 Tax=unclassified Kribbella TaxID=2644121 RepID=UPI0037A231BA
MSSERGWTGGDGLAVVAIVLALGAPALLGFSRTVQTPLLEATPAAVAAALAMGVSVAIFRSIGGDLRLVREGPLGRRLYVFVACLWILCPVLTIVRLADDWSALGTAAIVVQVAAIGGMVQLARSKIADRVKE